MKIYMECKHFRKTVNRNVPAYRWGKEHITSSPDVLSGEPVFRGTRIPLENVAALFRKQVPEREIAEDFPLSMRETWPMRDSLHDSGSRQDDPKGGCESNGNAGPVVDSCTAGRKRFALVGPDGRQLFPNPMLEELPTTRELSRVAARIETPNGSLLRR
jgi:uncharacterized protein (DUF433 family)